MEYRIEHDTMGEVKVPADKVLGRTDRAFTEQFQDRTRGKHAQGDHPGICLPEKSSGPDKYGSGCIAGRKDAD